MASDVLGGGMHHHIGPPLVLGRTAARQEAGSSGLSTKDTVMPSLGSV